MEFGELDCRGKQGNSLAFHSRQAQQISRSQTIFNAVLCVPAPPHPLAYYHSLLTELCRLSPQTIAPSLGKSVRKLYASLGNDSGSGGKIGAPVLDPSGVKRFADWFAVHLSNFGFMWGWGDWLVFFLCFTPFDADTDRDIDAT